MELRGEEYCKVCGGRREWRVNKKDGRLIAHVQNSCPNKDACFEEIVSGRFGGVTWDSTTTKGSSRG